MNSCEFLSQCGDTCSSLLRQLNVYYILTSYFFVFLFLGIKINDIKPYQVEVILTETLDINRPCVKNWWDVGRTLGISDSELQIVKQEYYREGGSPTKCLLGKLSTLGNVVSLRTFVETTHKLNRHDICKAIYEVYKSQETAV